ncbi:hypothetical protein [Xenorhabdus griffiniae]|uniref:Integrase n=1 Tax=Xenorhabdus griffiniae TaxID=351672 RepID=A0ABY9XER9_9GAMM|nr:hypothetical protein [Xenorhabdus griffiniae]MBD1226029.1 hypothetical protein [Xenorhabdus griffiniae]MBE8585853.1 hypothetical protein [Xenorhabdus griffiniae]WMV71400.1 hypothetical protein QL128_14650 [Xenorhabdus griffiniae]WNH01076.1 hypothetical protein QL112_014655 [Xenorhabdus griffiniae]
MSLDHGLLNIPLHKRGNIDNQIDKWKAEQARQKKDKQECIKYDFNTNKEAAKKLWALVDKDLIKAHAKKRGMKYSELRDILDGFVKWKPQKAIKVLPLFIKK